MEELPSLAFLQPDVVTDSLHAYQISKRIDLFLQQQGLDTTTPAGKAMFQMMGVFAEFERSMIQERCAHFQAFNRSVSLPVAGYDYNSDWTSSVGGTSHPLE